MVKKGFLFASAIVLMFLMGCKELEPIKNEMRAPAYPLVTIDPFTSAWSMTDKLYEDDVRHWTGKSFPLMGGIRVDGELYRFMGKETKPSFAVAPLSFEKAWSGAYTFDKPSGNWADFNYNDSSWKKGEAAFGTKEEMNVKTLWTSNNIWVRRTLEIAPEELAKYTFFVKYSHDDTFELFLNGEKIVSTGYEWGKNKMVELDPKLVESTGGKIVLAAHCENRAGGGLVDLGFYKAPKSEKLMERTAEQRSVDVQAMRTIYDFKCGNVDLKLTFAAPLFMDDFDLMSRPVNYLNYEVVSNDGKEHEVDFYFEACPNWARDNETQECVSEALSDERFNYVKTGTKSQNILGTKGDDRRIDWGYFYMAADKDCSMSAVGDPLTMRREFFQKGELSEQSTGEFMALSTRMGKVGSKSSAGYLMIGYDDLYAIQYFGENIRPYWNRKGDKSIQSQFALAADQHDSLMERCEDFDAQMMHEALAAGGKDYAELCALAYRQSISAHKLIETPQGEIAWLSKENFSNGSIGTVDVTYPSAPLFLYYNPELVKGLMNFIFYYSESGKWKKPFPAHDLGTYPLANGQTYPEDMPVEESGNMLILTGAVSRMEGNAEYAKKHWDILSVWVEFLVKDGFDPINQLCTDDFAGHLARNTNLSIKAIMGIAAYADMAKMLGKTDVANKYNKIAKDMAAKWKVMAAAGDHYRLTFDEGDTWSQKYNLVWDEILGYDIFDKEVAQTEIQYYLTKMNQYGLPLDSRRAYTKSDWIIWTATMASDKEAFQQIIAPTHDFFEETVDRIPMTDWYNTDAKTHVGFRARSVVGGYFIKMLKEKMNKN